MSIRALGRRIGKLAAALAAVAIAGATTLAVVPAAPAGALPAGTPLVRFDPVGGNNAFASIRGTGYEQALLSAESQASGLPSAAPTGAAALAPPTWTSLGPAPENGANSYGGANSGRVTGLAVAPGTNTLYLASAGGGVWSSTTNGASWSTTTDSQPNLAMGSITVDPTDPSYVFAGTGEANQCLDCFFGDGVMESADGGQTWTTVNPGGMFTGVDVGAITVIPGAASISTTTVLAGTSAGLYVSTDGGVTWALEGAATWAWGNAPVTSIALNTGTTPVSIYAYVRGTGLVESLDGGSTWSASSLNASLSGALGSGDTAAIALAPAATVAATTLYVSVGSYNGYVGFYSSTDGGSTWNQTPNCNGGGAATLTETGCVPFFTSDDYAYNGLNDDTGGDQSW